MKTLGQENKKVALMENSPLDRRGSTVDMHTYETVRQPDKQNKTSYLVMT